jgi:hypothetical protein
MRERSSTSATRPQGHQRLSLGHRGVTGLQAIIGAARREVGLTGELHRTRVVAHEGVGTREQLQGVGFGAQIGIGACVLHHPVQVRDRLDPMLLHGVRQGQVDARLHGQTPLVRPVEQRDGLGGMRQRGGVVVGLLARQPQPQVRQAQAPRVIAPAGHLDCALIVGRRRVDLAGLECDRA